MAFVCFGNDGYDYCDNGRYVLFNANKTHSLLFDYVSKDLTQLPELLEMYVSNRIDVESFELKKPWCNDNESKKIIRTLKSIHPYYEHECESVFLKTVGKYLNALLVHSKYRELHNEKKSEGEWREWYLGILQELVYPFLSRNALSMDEMSELEKLYENYKNTMEKLYESYRNFTGHNFHNSTEEAPVPAPPQAKGFYSELRTQEAIKWMLFFILDISAPGIGELPITQRAWLYDECFKLIFSMPDVKMTIKRSFNPPSLFRKKQDRSLEADQKYELQGLRCSVDSALKNVQVNYMRLEPEMSVALSSVARFAMNTSVSGIYEECGIENLHQLLYLEIMHMIQNGTIIRPCKHCEMYFVVTDRKEAYCGRKSKKNGERCSDIGSKRSWQTKVKEDPVLSAYTRARKTHHARWKSHGIMTEDEYKLWLEKAQKKLDEVRADELAIADFEKWLKI